MGPKDDIRSYFSVSNQYQPLTQPRPSKRTRSNSEEEEEVPKINKEEERLRKRRKSDHKRTNKRTPTQKEKRLQIRQTAEEIRRKNRTDDGRDKIKQQRKQAETKRKNKPPKQVKQRLMKKREQAQTRRNNLTKEERKTINKQRRVRDHLLSEFKKKKKDITDQAILNLSNKRGKQLTTSEELLYISFINEQWKRKQTLFNATTLDETPISPVQKLKIGAAVNKWLAKTKDNRHPIQNDKESWDRMKVYYDIKEEKRNEIRSTPISILNNNRHMQAFNSFYVPPAIKKPQQKKKGRKKKKGNTSSLKKKHDDKEWVCDRENEIKFLTKTAKQIYKTLGRTPPREHWEDKIKFRNKLEMVFACICTGNTTDLTMTRGIQALQFFDMFSYNYFVNATEEDMKDMQCLLIYVGFNKARERPPTIIGTCKIIQTIFNGELPDKIEDWMGFYNIGRKIASLIMSDALGFFLFLVVDTHLEQVLPALRWTELKKATDIAIEIEEWLRPKLLKETNESIVGIRQLYRSCTQPQQLYIREEINKIKTISWTQLLVGLKHK